MANAVEKSIKEWRKGDYIKGFYLIKTSEQKTSTTNNKYMNFTFSDITGEVNAKLWDSADINVSLYPQGVIIYAEGQVNEWQGSLQLKIDKIRRSADTDNVGIDRFVPSAPQSGQDMLDFILNVVNNIQNEELKILTQSILDEYKDRLLIYPGAKANHHSVRSGLLYHVSTMLKSAIALSSVYEFLNKDLLYTGVILHDIGKIEEMNISEDTGLVEAYSKGGILLGHITQGIVIVSKHAQKLGISNEITLLISHMILSHHYEPEFGSPKYPYFPEAEMLHYLDIMDARMYDMKKILDSVDPGNFSERVRTLDNRNIYKADI